MDLEEDEAALDFQRLLKLNSKKSKVEWNKFSSNFKKELREFQQAESVVYPDGFLAASSTFHSPYRHNNTKDFAQENEDVEDTEQGGNLLLVQEAHIPERSTWKSSATSYFPVAAEKDTDLYSYHHQNNGHEIQVLEEERLVDRVLPAEESCLQIISKDQLLGNSQLFEQSFICEEQGQSASDFAILESRAFDEENARDDEVLHTRVPDKYPLSEQALIKKYFKESLSHDFKKTGRSKDEEEYDTKIKSLEADVSDLTRDLAKARQQTIKFRRERDEWERKEAAARNEKVGGLWFRRLNLTCFKIGPATQMGLARNVTIKGRTH